MTWYAAHIVIGMKVIDEITPPISVYENVVLIKAETHHEALSIAKKMGESEENLQDGLELDGKPATRIFAGVRKIIKVIKPDSLDEEGENQPKTDTETTHSEFEVNDVDELIRLAQGEIIPVLYIE
jgi:hypothetical protein